MTVLLGWYQNAVGALVFAMIFRAIMNYTHTMANDEVDAATIEIGADKRKGITVDFVGKPYTVRKPKAALGLRVAMAGKKADDDPENMMKAMDSLVDMMFGKKDGAAIRKRLEDPEDDLDYDHLVQLVQALGETGENPTS